MNCFAITGEGELYQWGEMPMNTPLSSSISFGGEWKAKEVIFDPQLKVKIRAFSSNGSVALGVSRSGLVYSWGYDATHSSILGLGDLQLQLLPKCIQSLIFTK